MDPLAQAMSAETRAHLEPAGRGTLCWSGAAPVALGSPGGRGGCWLPRRLLLQKREKPRASPAPPWLGAQPSASAPASSLKGARSPGWRLAAGGVGRFYQGSWGQGLTSDLWHALTQTGLPHSPAASDTCHRRVGVGPHSPRAPPAPNLRPKGALAWPPRPHPRTPGAPSTLRASQAWPTASHGEGMSRKTASATWLTPKPLRHTSWLRTVTHRPTRCSWNSSRAFSARCWWNSTVCRWPVGAMVRMMAWDTEPLPVPGAGQGTDRDQTGPPRKPPHPQP